MKVFGACDAQIENRDGRPIRFSTLQKGRRVKVKGKLRDDGALHAEEMKVRKDKEPDEAEVKGKVQGIDKARRMLTVMGLTIHVTPTTKIGFD